MSTVDTRSYARHLRGTVQRSSIGWRFSIVNTDTGQVVAYDNGHRDLSHAFTDAEFATAACRHAWIRGFGAKSLWRDGQVSR